MAGLFWGMPPDGTKPKAPCQRLPVPASVMESRDGCPKFRARTEGWVQSALPFCRRQTSGLMGAVRALPNQRFVWGDVA